MLTLSSCILFKLIFYIQHLTAHSHNFGQNFFFFFNVYYDLLIPNSQPI